MIVGHLKDIERLSAEHWKAAAAFRANFGFASNEYLMPVMGSLFPRHTNDTDPTDNKEGS